MRMSHTRHVHVYNPLPPFLGGVGLRIVAACRNSNRDMYIVCILYGPQLLAIKKLNDFILWVMFLKANTCIPSFCESKILTELRFKHQRVTGENNIYCLTNKYSLLKTRFRNDNSYTLTFK